MRQLKTKDDVVHELGGYRETAKLLKVAYQAPHNWCNYMDHFPSRLYVVMMEALAKKNCTAPPVLWGMWPYHKRPGTR